MLKVIFNIDNDPMFTTRPPAAPAAPTLRPDLTAAAVLLAAGTALRALAVPDGLGDVDSVNLARGLARFDPFAQSPHFPGYPVLVALARGVQALGLRHDAWALALPGILLWPFAGWVLYRGLALRVGPSPALSVLTVSSIAPGAVLHGGWPGSEGLGFSLLCAAVGGLLHEGRAPRALSAFALGLLLGVRLSWWPLALSAGLVVLLLERRSILDFAAAISVGVLAWLAPMLAMFGADELLQLALGFSSGHFHAWGGSSFAKGAASLASRAQDALRGLSFVAFGLPHAAPSLLAAGGALALLLAFRGRVSALSPAPRRAALVVLLSLAPYACWLLVAQNVDKSRHLLPLLPMIGLVLGAALSAAHARARTKASLAALLAVLGAHAAIAQRSEPVPAVAFARWLAQAHEPAGLLVFAGEEARVLEHWLPMYRIVRPANSAVLEHEAARAHAQGVAVWISDGCPASELIHRDRPAIARFERRSHRPHEAALTIHRFVPDPTYAQRSTP